MVIINNFKISQDLIIKEKNKETNIKNRNQINPEKELYLLYFNIENLLKKCENKDLEKLKNEIIEYSKNNNILLKNKKFSENKKIDFQELLKKLNYIKPSEEDKKENNDYINIINNNSNNKKLLLKLNLLEFNLNQLEETIGNKNKLNLKKNNLKNIFKNIFYENENIEIINWKENYNRLKEMISKFDEVNKNKTNNNLIEKKEIKIINSILNSNIKYKDLNNDLTSKLNKLRNIDFKEKIELSSKSIYLKNKLTKNLNIIKKEILENDIILKQINNNYQENLIIYKK